MAVYGDFDDRFRARPALWRTAVVSFGHFAVPLVLTGAAVMFMPHRLAHDHAIEISVAFLLLGSIVLHFWPTRNTLARRLFISAFAETMFVFGAGWYALQKPTLLSLALLLLAATRCAAAETRAIGVLASVVELSAPLPRFQYWFARIVPAMGLLAAVPSRTVNYLAFALAAITLLMNVIRRPTRFEVVEEPEMREATATMAVVIVAVAAALIWALSAWSD